MNALNLLDNYGLRLENKATGCTEFVTLRAIVEAIAADQQTRDALGKCLMSAMPTSELIPLEYDDWTKSVGEITTAEVTE